MNYTYTWTDVDQSSLKRIDADGNVSYVPTDPLNVDYAHFLSSGAVASPYVAPPEPPPLTSEEKLANSGLTVDELKDLLDL